MYAREFSSNKQNLSEHTGNLKGNYFKLVNVFTIMLKEHDLALKYFWKRARQECCPKITAKRIWSYLKLVQYDQRNFKH